MGCADGGRGGGGPLPRLGGAGQRRGGDRQDEPGPRVRRARGRSGAPLRRRLRRPPDRATARAAAGRGGGQRRPAGGARCAPAGDVVRRGGRRAVAAHAVTAARRRGPALGRRRHPRRAGLPRRGRIAALPAVLVLTYRDEVGRRRPPACTRLLGLAREPPSSGCGCRCGAAARARRGRAGGRVRLGPRQLLHAADRRQPVLRHRGAGRHRRPAAKCRRRCPTRSAGPGPVAAPRAAARAAVAGSCRSCLTGSSRSSMVDARARRRRFTRWPRPRSAASWKSLGGGRAGVPATSWPGGRSSRACRGCAGGTLHRVGRRGAVPASATRSWPRLVHHAVRGRRRRDGRAAMPRSAGRGGRCGGLAPPGASPTSRQHCATGHRLRRRQIWPGWLDEHAWELYNAGRFTEALRGGERARCGLRRRGCPRPPRTTAPSRRRRGAGYPAALSGPDEATGRRSAATRPAAQPAGAIGPRDDGSGPPRGPTVDATLAAQSAARPTRRTTAAARPAVRPTATAAVPSPRRWCGCRGTGSWRATPTAPTPRPRRPSPCSTHRPTPPARDPIPRARRRTGRSPRRTSARSARSPATPAPTIGTTIGPPTRSCAAPGSWRRRRAAPTSWRSAATTRASPAPTSTTTPGSRCSPAACAPDWSRASTRSRRAPTRTSASCASA